MPNPGKDPNLRNGGQYVFATHFETYLVCDKVALYKVEWHSQSMLEIKNGNPATTTVFGGFGGGPNEEIPEAQVQEIRRRFPDHNEYGDE